MMHTFQPGDLVYFYSIGARGIRCATVQAHVEPHNIDVPTSDGSKRYTDLFHDEDSARKATLERMRRERQQRMIAVMEIDLLIARLENK